MELPTGWRLGRLQNGCRTLFYKDTWAERIPVDEGFEEKVFNLIQNPHPRLYPLLYQDGALEVGVLSNEQGVRNLVKAGLLLPADAIQLTPSIIKWLKRNGLYEEQEKSKNPQVRINNYIYEKRGRRWGRLENESWNPLIPRIHFQSVWAARVAYAKQEVTLEQIAEYSWGAVLEVIGDQMQLLPDYTEQTLLTFRKQVYTAIKNIIDMKTDIVGFTKSESGLWEAIYRIEPLNTNSLKEKRFWYALDKLLRCQISGYGARLILNNAHPNAIYFEQRRWDRCSTVYIPYLRHKQKKLDSMTLEQVRTYVQKNQCDMIAVGYLPSECKTTAFTYRGNRYGLHIESGKIFSIISDESKYIPKQFDKWSEDKQREYLEEDFERLKEDYCKRLRACRKLYYYLKVCQKLSSRRAWEIATQKHRKLNLDFAKRRRSAARWNCFYVNSTAVPLTVCTPEFRLGVA